MGVFSTVVKDVLTSGPDNLKKLMGAVDKLPSDETLIRLAETLDKLAPYLPELSKALQNGTLTSLESVVKKVPDTKTLKRLLDLAPMLERVPDTQTLNRLLDKADVLKEFIDRMEAD